MHTSAMDALFRRVLVATALSAAGCGPMTGPEEPTPTPSASPTPASCGLTSGSFYPADSQTLEPLLADGTLTVEECGQVCPTSEAQADCWFEEIQCCEPATVDGQTGLTCYGPVVCIGRRPAGLAEASPRPAGNPLGDWFARAARLEAASIQAFRTLSRELEAHDAPRALVEAARAAARDEARHTRLTVGLARAHGARWQRPEVTRAAPRSLEALAVENAAEGCVLETFGALVGAWQAEHAADPAIQAVMRLLAVDETGHAALAWQIDAWARRRLSPGARSRVEAARHTMFARLSSQLEEPPPALRQTAGLPGADQARTLLQHLRLELARTVHNV